jgi:transposase-like protein
MHTTTKGEGKAEVIDLKGLLAREEDFVRAAVGALVQVALEAEMTEAIGAARGARNETRLSYRSGYHRLATGISIVPVTAHFAAVQASSGFAHR